MTAPSPAGTSAEPLEGPRTRGQDELPPLVPLERLRWRLTAWYLATVSATIVILGAGLFIAVARGIAAKRDASLIRAATAAGDLLARAPAGTDPRSTFATIRIPDRSLYLFDLQGQPLVPDSASRWVRGAAARAAIEGAISLQADIGGEHTLQLHAARFAVRGARFVIVATADTEELEDEYASVIAAFSLAAAAAVALVAAGGFWLARKSTAPVVSTVAHMRRFMADAAHELRTPVAALLARAAVTLAQTRDAATYAAAIRDLHDEASRLSRTLDDLLMLARADAAERPIERRRVFLDDVALDAAHAARAMGAHHGVTVDVTDFRESPVTGDPALIRQLLMTVLDNAVKYTPAGGRVTIGVSADGDAARVVVEDTGIGISAEAAPHLFERFYRADPARGRAGGAGLGLSIARWICDAHGATIAITPRPERGTRVELRFPLVR